MGKEKKNNEVRTGECRIMDKMGKKWPREKSKVLRTHAIRIPQVSVRVTHRLGMPTLNEGAPRGPRLSG